MIQHIHTVLAVADSVKIEGFISLTGAYSKVGGHHLHGSDDAEIRANRYINFYVRRGSRGGHS